MGKATGRILKSNDVKLEGQIRLDVRQTVPNSANGKNAASFTPQVCIVENHPEFAVIEVTCGCGAKTHIRCEYTDTQSTEQESNQKDNGENNNASQ